MNMRRLFLIALLALVYTVGMATTGGCGFGGGGTYTPQSAPPAAQWDGTMTGMVVDESSGAPIVGASVKVTQGSLTRSVFSDSTGRYEVIALGSGSASVSVTASGYARLSRSVRLTNGENHLDIRLHATP